MKKFIPVIALMAAAAFVLGSYDNPAVAEDPKQDPDLFDNGDGVKIWKPKGKDQWKIIGEGGWDTWFKDAGGVQFMLVKWAADNKDGDLQKSPPLVRMYGVKYDTQGKFKIGDWEGTPSSTKGFAKAIFEQLLDQDYKNPKNVQETAKAVYPCGSCYQFSCYGEHKKYGGSHYLRILICKKDSKDTYQFVVGSAPGEEKMDGKHSGEEIEMVLKSIKFYDKK